MIRVLVSVFVLVGLFSHALLAEDTMPNHVKQSINKILIGEFDVSMKLGPEESKGTYQAVWMPGEACVRIEAVTNGANETVYLNEIMGWEADSKSLVVHGFGPGGHWTIRYTDVSEKKWTGLWKGYMDGEAQTSKSMLESTPNGFVYRDTTNGLDLVLTAVRKK